MDRRGFTLVELIIIIAIIALMGGIMVGILNPAMLIVKANDAQRKKDLGRIKIAFEEYYNDKGCYPGEAVVAELKDRNNCWRKIPLFPQLAMMFCDPASKEPYLVSIDPSACPHWFKIFTQLRNPEDSAIPENWNYLIGYHVGEGEYTNRQVNFGVSSNNVSWSEFVLDPKCDSQSRGCFRMSANGCNSTISCEGSDCYAGWAKPADGQMCVPECQVAKCP